MPSLPKAFSCIRLGLILVAFATLWASAQDPNPGGKVRVAAGKETEGSKKLWGALIYATEDVAFKREGFPDADAEMVAMLSKAFDQYTSFQVLGTRAEALFKSTHSWVAPSKQLCIKFDSKGLTKDGSGVKIDLQLWSRGKAIVKTDAIFKPGSPVFMEGPHWGKGRLLYVLKLQDDAAVPPID